MLYPNNPMLADRRWRPFETPSGLAHGFGLGSNMGGKRVHSAVFDLPQGRCPALLGIRPARGLKPESPCSGSMATGEGEHHGASLP
jgi:hypothetical protein